MCYAILVFAMFPLFVLGSAQTIAESLVVNVLAYTTAFLPLLSDHVLVTSLVALHALGAAMIAFAYRDEVEFTDGTPEDVQFAFFRFL